GDVSCLVQFGGQTPLKLALGLQRAGVRIPGTSPDSIDLAADRQRFAALLSELDITQPASGTAPSREEAREAAAAIGFPVVGLLNVQCAIKDNVVYVLEVNPRGSRTVPYLSKARGVSLAKVAARVMAGRTVAELGLTKDLEVAGVFVKSPVFPFVRFPGVDTILGPEMKSTGEVMGGASSFGVAFAKAQLAVGQRLPESGTAFVSVNNHDKPNLLPIARDLSELGF